MKMQVAFTPISNTSFQRILATWLSLSAAPQKLGRKEGNGERCLSSANLPFGLWQEFTTTATSSRPSKIVGVLQWRVHENPLDLPAWLFIYHISYMHPASGAVCSCFPIAMVTLSLPGNGRPLACAGLLQVSRSITALPWALPLQLHERSLLMEPHRDALYLFEISSFIQKNLCSCFSIIRTNTAKVEICK